MPRPIKPDLGARFPSLEGSSTRGGHRVAVIRPDKDSSGVQLRACGANSRLGARAHVVDEISTSELGK